MNKKQRKSYFLLAFIFLFKLSACDGPPFNTPPQANISSPEIYRAEKLGNQCIDNLKEGMTEEKNASMNITWKQNKVSHNKIKFSVIPAERPTIGMPVKEYIINLYSPPKNLSGRIEKLSPTLFRVVQDSNNPSTILGIDTSKIKSAWLKYPRHQLTLYEEIRSIRSGEKYKTLREYVEYKGWADQDGVYFLLWFELEGRYVRGESHPKVFDVTVTTDDLKKPDFNSCPLVFRDEESLISFVDDSDISSMVCSDYNTSDEEFGLLCMHNKSEFFVPAKAVFSKNYGAEISLLGTVPGSLDFDMLHTVWTPIESLPLK